LSPVQDSIQFTELLSALDLEAQRYDSLGLAEPDLNRMNNCQTSSSMAQPSEADSKGMEQEGVTNGSETGSRSRWKKGKNNGSKRRDRL